MLLTTTNTIEGKEITQYFGIVSGETIIGANVFKDFFAGIRDIVGGRAGSYESVLREAKETALKEMSDHATQLGANAVIAIDLFLLEKIPSLCVEVQLLNCHYSVHTPCCNNIVVRMLSEPFFLSNSIS